MNATLSQRLTTRPTNHITNEIKVWQRYAIEIADNGERDDKAVTLCLAPQCGGAGNEYLYLVTNGDPILVGWLDGDEVQIADSAEAWINDDDEQVAWIRAAIHSL